MAQREQHISAAAVVLVSLLVKLPEPGGEAVAITMNDGYRRLILFAIDRSLR